MLVAYAPSAALRGLWAGPYLRDVLSLIADSKNPEDQIYLICDNEFYPGYHSPSSGAVESRARARARFSLAAL